MDLDKFLIFWGRDQSGDRKAICKKLEVCVNRQKNSIACLLAAATKFLIKYIIHI